MNHIGSEKLNSSMLHKVEKGYWLGLYFAAPLPN